MEFHQGPDGEPARAPLRLVDTGAAWEPDPAADSDELDALAELFIGTDDDGPDETIGTIETERSEAAARPAGAADTPSVEAIITGHLPVRGAVWVRAYAAAVARSEGRPIALVRVTSERTTVELVGSLVDTDPVRDIDLAIQAVSSATEHWLLHFDELDQAGLLKEPNLGRVTVLSGADEPAIVSAYRLLKTVSDDRNDAADEGRLDVGVSIVGSPQDETSRAIDRLGIAARRFLHVELGGRMAVPKVETASVSLIGELETRCDPAVILASIADCVDQPSADAQVCIMPVQAAPARASVHAPRGAEPIERVIRGPEAKRHEANRPETQRGEADANADIPDKASPTGPHAAQADSDLPAPSTLVAGLTGLDLPCPVAQSVEIATDAEGGLHLLAWWDDAAPAALLKARVWAGINFPLLARVGPIDATRRFAALHVVCDDLGAAVDLRGGDIRVHLAQPVSAATTNGWVTTVVQ